MKKLSLLMMVALLAACASKPPASVSKIPPENPTLTLVRMNIDDYIGAEVRWGGVISKVENKADRTWIEIVRHKLRDNARPITSSKSDGRFIASFEKFADPIVYEAGRPLTVVGTIEAKTSRPIGEYDYLFPVVSVEGSFLWKKYEPVPASAYPPPYWYYDPWYHHPWPYYHHGHHH